LIHALALLLAAAPAADAAGARAAVERLVPGRTLQRSIARGQRHEFRIAVRAGEFVQVAVAARAATVRAALSEAAPAAGAPRPGPIVVPGGHPAPPLVWQASADAELALAIWSDGGTRGRYTVRADVRAPTSEDHARVRYQSLRTDAQRLRRTGAPAMPQAVEAFRAALAAAQEVRDPALVAAALKSLAWAQHESGDVRGAEATFDTLLRTMKGQGPLEAEALFERGTYHLFLDETQEALTAFQRALPLARAQKMGGLEGGILDHMGVVYGRVGDDRRGLDYYRQALALVSREGQLLDEASLRLKMGNMAVGLGRLDEALPELTAALQVWRKELPDVRREATVRLALARVHRQQGRPAEALEHLRRALEFREPTGPAHTAAMLIELGLTHEALGDAERALEATREAHALLPMLAPQSAHRWRVMAQTARLHRDAGRLDEARRWVEAAAAAADTGWAALASEGLRYAYAELTSGVYDLEVDVLMRLHERSPGEDFDRRALESSERGRARGLRELLREARVTLPRQVDAALLAQEAAVREKVAAAAEKRRLLGMEGRTDTALDRELQALTTEHDELRGRIRAADPRYASVAHAAPPSAAQIQALVEPGTALLEYDLGPTRSYLWVATAGGITSHVLPGEEEIGPLARALHERITARNRAAPKESGAQRRARLALGDEEAAQAAARLGALLLGPVPGLAALRRIVVVPDGVLHYVPFAVLAPPGEARGAPLIASHEVLHLPSAAVLATLRQQSPRPPARRELAIFADPVFDGGDGRVSRRGAARGGPARFRRLAYTRTLARDVAAGVPESARRVALDFDASREAVTGGGLEQYRTLLFATHGVLNSEYPELSGLALSMVDEKGRARDGFLRLQDVYHLELNADLVVLGACETGLGREVRGEGLVGLSGGFFYAGARRVLASLWKVDEQATVDLIGELYRRLRADGLPTAAALRQAQLKLRDEPHFRSPYYWAGFVLQGDW
jgi:CHAT domain-containing protein/tetratricopeptide (TPR) repeat protein